MTTPETVTCGDLAMLGGPWDYLAKHDPCEQRADDPHCYCWQEPTPADWCRSHEAPPDLPERLIVQSCREMVALNIPTGYRILLCCRCFESYAPVVARWPPHEVEHRLITFARQALAYRDQLRLDSSQVPCDMDVQAAAVLDDLEGDEQ